MLDITELVFTLLDWYDTQHWLWICWLWTSAPSGQSRPEWDWTIPLFNHANSPLQLLTITCFQTKRPNLTLDTMTILLTACHWQKHKHAHKRTQPNCMQIVCFILNSAGPGSKKKKKNQENSKKKLCQAKMLVLMTPDHNPTHYNINFTGTERWTE